jgi:hypothetical protein
LLSLGGELPWDVAPRRAKNEKDFKIVGKKVGARLIVDDKRQARS